MKRHYEQLKEYNFKLKAKQKEVNFHVLWFFGFLGLLCLSLVLFFFNEIHIFIFFGLCLFYMCCVESMVGPILFFNLWNLLFLQLSINGPKGENKNLNLVINQPIQVSVNSSNFTAENEEKMKQQIIMQIPNHDNHNFGHVQFQCASSSSNPTLQVASSSFGRNSNMGPLAIPDLNLSIEESVHVDTCQPLDEATSNNIDASKVMAAQARQRRIQIFRLKKPVGNNNTKQRQPSYR